MIIRYHSEVDIGALGRDLQREIASPSLSWTRSTLSHDQVIMSTKAKAHVQSDSVLCLGNMHEHKEASRRRESQIEFELIFPWLSSFGILQKTQNDLQEPTFEPEQFGANYFWCQCSMTSIGHEKRCIFECRKCQDAREENLAGTLDVPGSWKRKEVVWRMHFQTWRKMEFHCFPNGAAIQGNMPPSIHKCQCFESWNLKEVERKTIHFNADTSNTKLLFSKQLGWIS